MTAAGDLLEIVMRSYERANTLLTSNRPVDDWGKLLGGYRHPRSPFTADPAVSSQKFASRRFAPTILSRSSQIASTLPGGKSAFVLAAIMPGKMSGTRARDRFDLERGAFFLWMGNVEQM
jgi:hypothetical protein